ncbi:gas vesicle protein GvpO [Jeotgalibacillus soli]|uniref:Uncharacterized protein n=1 Tax=Jeotgalibacillus soli TaxID=889306 RepID=A0A0C2W1X3_9BACL|nr:gas vesicle protein GvpO [Jeotgalibacillus soli]KIL50626.1 hypothetical protein KP78_06270 [Jeotgalibacillus soli]
MLLDLPNPLLNEKAEAAMEFKEIMNNVSGFFSEYIAPPRTITSVEANEEGWKVTVEVIEEKEYMKEYAKD